MRVGILVAEVEGFAQGLGDRLRVAGELGSVEVGEVEVDYVAYCADGGDNSGEMGFVSCEMGEKGGRGEEARLR